MCIINNKPALQMTNGFPYLGDIVLFLRMLLQIRRTYLERYRNCG